MTDNTTKDIFINGRKVATLRNGGALCDIRRYKNGFLYHGGYSVAVNEELLEQLPDTTVLQFINMDSKDVYTITVRDFRHASIPWAFGTERQRKCEIVKMNHTVAGKPKTTKKRVNELVHIEAAPIEQYQQESLFG